MTDKDRRRVILALTDRAAGQRRLAQLRSNCGPQNAEYRQHLRQEAAACMRLAADIKHGYVVLSDVPSGGAGSTTAGGGGGSGR